MEIVPVIIYVWDSRSQKASISAHLTNEIVAWLLLDSTNNLFVLSFVAGDCQAIGYECL